MPDGRCSQHSALVVPECWAPRAELIVSEDRPPRRGDAVSPSGASGTIWAGDRDDGAGAGPPGRFSGHSNCGSDHVGAGEPGDGVAVVREFGWSTRSPPPCSTRSSLWAAGSDDYPVRSLSVNVSLQSMVMPNRLHRGLPLNHPSGAGSTARDPRAKIVRMTVSDGSATRFVPKFFELFSVDPVWTRRDWPIAERVTHSTGLAVHSGAMSTPQPTDPVEKNLELSVEELLRRAKLHPPYGEHVIDDLTPQEAEDFLAAVLS